MKDKKIASDLLWSILALATMHGVLQLAVYPFLNRQLGAEKYGEVLYLLAVLGIMAPSAGLAANNRRLIDGGEGKTANGDYLISMLPHGAAYICVFLALCGGYLAGTGNRIAGALLVVFTMLRFYGDVGFRMTLNYRGYFFYYLTLSAGYLLGVLLYPLTGSWLLCFLLGETLCVVPAAWSRIYRPVDRSPALRRICRQTAVLSFSYLLSNTVLYLDRLLLQNLLNGEAVSVYYTASLLGKTAALLITPLNSVIIGYLSKYRIRMDRKRYLRAGLLAMGAGAVLYVGILIATPIFTRLFYPDLSDAVRAISTTANLGQVLFFIASPLLVVMLTFCGSGWQLLIQAIYAAVFIPACYIGVRLARMQGFVWGGIAANFLRLALVFGAGLILVGKNSAVGAGEADSQQRDA